MKKLGVIGGMGPAATALFYDYINKLTPATKDQEHIPMVILNDTLMPDRTAAILGSDELKAQVSKKLLEDALYLKLGGCDAIAITCNTAHYFADKLEKDSGVELFHMIRLTANEAAKRCTESNNRVAILATDGTIKTKVYQNAIEALNLKAWIPTEDIQKKVMHVIYDIVKSGHEASEADWADIDSAVKNAGCSCAILGCTELSVVRSDLSLKDYYIDAMEVLAKYCVAHFNTF